MINRKINTFIPELYPKNERINMNSLESGSNVQSGLEMIMEKSPDTIVLVDRNLTLVKVISAKDDYYHYLANNCIGKQPQALFPDGKNYDQYEIYRAVSYTHLDVYKRQYLGLVGGSRLRLYGG